MSERESIVHTEEGDSTRGLIQNLTAKQVSVVAFIVAAGCYGYIGGKWGNAAVDMSSTAAYPEYAWVFMVFGLATGVGFSATVVMIGERDD